MKAQGFTATFVFRPGLLERGEKARGVEKLASRLLSSTPVKDIATAMIKEAEAGQTGLHVYSGADITKATSKT